MLNAEPAETTHQICVVNAKLHQQINTAAEGFMKRAAEEAVRVSDCDTEISFALDGSWQKRGHTSNNSIFSPTSMNTVKVLDVRVMSIHCSVYALKYTSCASEPECQ